MTNHTTPGPLASIDPATLAGLEGYRPAQPSRDGGMAAPGFWGIFHTVEQGQAALAESLEAREFNYYVTWIDVAGFGLQAGWAEWVGEGRPHVNRSEAW
jgi:hypothetical protein